MKKLILTILFCLIPVMGHCGIDFAGDLDYIKSGANTGISSALNRTTSIWFRTSNTTSDITWATQGVDEALKLYSISRDLPSDANKIRVAINAGSRIWDWAAHDDGNWHHLVIILNGTKTSDLTAYGDGVVLSVSSTNDQTINTTDSLFYIGYEFLASKAPFPGDITEVALWNTDLTEQEAIILSGSRSKRIPLQIQPDNLILYYPIDEYEEGSNMNTDIDGYKDLSSIANHGQGVDADNDSVNIPESVSTYQ